MNNDVMCPSHLSKTVTETRLRRRSSFPAMKARQSRRQARFNPTRRQWIGITVGIIAGPRLATRKLLPDHRRQTTRETKSKLATCGPRAICSRTCLGLRLLLPPSTTAPTICSRGSLSLGTIAGLLLEKGVPAWRFVPFPLTSP